METILSQIKPSFNLNRHLIGDEQVLTALLVQPLLREIANCSDGQLYYAILPSIYSNNSVCELVNQGSTERRASERSELRPSTSFQPLY